MMFVLILVQLFNLLCVLAVFHQLSVINDFIKRWECDAEWHPLTRNKYDVR